MAHEEFQGKRSFSIRHSYSFDAFVDKTLIIVFFFVTRIIFIVFVCLPFARNSQKKASQFLTKTTEEESSRFL